MARREDCVPRGLIRTEDVNYGGILAGDTEGVVARPVIENQDFIAGTQRLKSPSQAEPVVAGVQDGSDQRHRKHVIGTRGGEVEQLNLKKGHGIPCPFSHCMRISTADCRWSYPSDSGVNQVPAPGSRSADSA